MAIHYESRTRAPGVSWQERELWHERWASFSKKATPLQPDLARKSRRLLAKRWMTSDQALEQELDYATNQARMLRDRFTR